MDANTLTTPLGASEFRHGLRTPLNHLIGYSEILREDYPQWADRIDGILGECNQLLDSLQQTVGSDQVTVTAALLERLSVQMSGGTHRILRILGEMREAMPAEAQPDIARMSAAISSLEKALTPAAVSAEPNAVSLAPGLTPGDRQLSLDPTSGPGRILVVDDDEMNRDMLSRQLEKRGHTVSVAADGPAALEMLQSGRFEVVLLDLIMPKMNGFEVLQAIRSHPALGQVAVILTSALDEIDMVVRCIEAGAEDYLFKPIDPILLRARLKSTLDKIRAEETVRRKQRLESIGLLAAGIAHDFNNLLTGIIGHAQLLQQHLDSSRDRDMASSILTAGERAAELTRQLLAYSGKGNFEMEAIDLVDLIRENEDLIRAGLPKRAQLQLRLTKIPEIRADANQLRQTILNLTLNAGEAVPPGTPASITIETGVEELASEHFDVMPEQPDQGQFGWFEVRDNGSGMDPATVSKIFEPFFTTKFLGRGLGLAAVAGIVRSHRGYLRVQTAPGQGSVFRVYFPLAAKGETVRRRANSDARILVVDDENIVCQIVKVALERAGRKVLIARSGEEAVETVVNASEDIPLALIDWKLPGMDGLETVRRLRQLRPDLKAIVSSGFAQAEAEDMFREANVSAFLQKPYKMTELVALVNRCIQVAAVGASN